MDILAITLAIVLVLLSALQLIPAGAFLAALWRRHSPQPASGDYRPMVAVVLCLRGRDPFLEQCLESLLRQDYPHYDVWIVIDRTDDPVWATVEGVVARTGATNVVVRPLVERSNTCARKCSSLIQAVGELDARYEVLALTDGDAALHRTWLSELVAPLAEAGVGAASGNRWYMPAEPTWGSLVRYAWNAGAVVQMYLNRFTWGGSVALRSEVFRDPELVERWRRSVSSDTVIYRIVRKNRLRTVFVPSLMLINRETCALPQFARWVKRQMAVGRLYHPGWPAVLLHGVVTSSALLLGAAVLLVSLVLGRWQAAAWTAAGLVCFELSNLVLLAVLEWSIRRTVRVRGERGAWLSARALLRGLAALPLTQLLYAAILWQATFVDSVEWRGVTYRIHGPWDVRVVDDESTCDDPAPHAAASL